MVSSKRGRRDELELCRAIYRRTDGRLVPEPIGYSGNHVVPSPDIVIDTGRKRHAIEHKSTASNRLSVTYDPSDTGADDIDQLLTYADEYPRTVVPHVAVTFTRRQLTMGTLWLPGDDIEAALDGAVATCETSVNRTRSNNLSFHRPSADEWYSAQAGDSVAYLLSRIGYDGPLAAPD